MLLRVQAISVFQRSTGICIDSIRACSFTSVPQSFDNIPGIFDDPEATICDTVEASAEFQAQAGPQAVENFTGGEYYLPGITSYAVGKGSCADVIAAQDTCTQDLTQESFGSVRSDPSLCMENTERLEDTDWYKTIMKCKSAGNDGVTVVNDMFEVYIDADTDANPLGFVCDGEEKSLTPKLTSKDWIEPVPGRRYMCYEWPIDFVEGNDLMYMFFLNVGNEPCKGPSSTDGEASGAYSLAGFAIQAAVVAGVALAATTF